MRSAGFKAFLIVLFFLATSAISRAVSAEENPVASQSLSESSEIKIRLMGVEKKQQDILAQKEAILQELDLLRVRVRHSGSNQTE